MSVLHCVLLQYTVRFVNLCLCWI